MAWSTVTSFQKVSLYIPKRLLIIHILLRVFCYNVTKFSAIFQGSKSIRASTLSTVPLVGLHIWFFFRLPPQPGAFPPHNSPPPYFQWLPWKSYMTSGLAERIRLKDCFAVCWKWFHQNNHFFRALFVNKKKNNCQPHSASHRGHYSSSIGVSASSDLYPSVGTSTWNVSVSHSLRSPRGLYLKKTLPAIPSASPRDQYFKISASHSLSSFLWNSTWGSLCQQLSQILPRD